MLSEYSREDNVALVFKCDSNQNIKELVLFLSSLTLYIFTGNLNY